MLSIQLTEDAGYYNGKRMLRTAWSIYHVHRFDGIRIIGATQNCTILACSDYTSSAKSVQTINQPVSIHRKLYPKTLYEVSVDTSKVLTHALSIRRLFARAAKRILKTPTLVVIRRHGVILTFQYIGLLLVADGQEIRPAKLAIQMTTYPRLVTAYGYIPVSTSSGIFFWSK